MFMPTLEAAFGKGGVLRLCFRKTGWHIAALTLEQMCLLFFLKRACECNKGSGSIPTAFRGVIIGATLFFFTSESSKSAVLVLAANARF